jgi:hypothetical protein
LRINQQRVVKVFLDEFMFFTRVCELADKLVEKEMAKTTSEKPSKQVE